MKLQAVWTGILYVFDLISLSAKPLPETHLPAIPVSSVPAQVSEVPHKFDDGSDDNGTPIIGVPRREGGFNCSYPAMKDYVNCHKPGHRGCWLRHNSTGEEYNITTDYDDLSKVPTGIVREVNLQLLTS